MQSMIDFTTWFLEELPDFLWSEPIRYLWALLLLGYIIKLLLNLKSY